VTARSATGFAVVAAALLALAPSAAAQGPERINIYRFILDIDVPEPAALVAMDLAPGHVLRASAPKPVAASLAFAYDSGSGATRSAALDFSPYFLLGGGIRRLESYRSMTLWGRLRRVITKTLLSLGAAWDPADPDSPRVALGLRSTFHDPHDPIPPPGGLVERVDSALRAAGETPADEEEDVAGRRADLRGLYLDAERAMRAKRGIQVGGGWAMAGRLGGARFAGDSLGDIRHTLWVATQYTFGPRFDLLGTLQVWNGFDDTHTRLGAALMRKTTAVDLTTELYFDSADDRLHPGAWVEGRLLPRVRAGAALGTETDASGGDTRLRVRAFLRWYVAQAFPR
jgi:hypothetical protein